MWLVEQRIVALGDLLRRYREVWRCAWRRRDERDERERRVDYERQFLPAALELQETPVSPAPRVLMWLLIGLIGVAIAWAACGRIDIVATARGKIVPGDRVKLVQPAGTAIVKAIHVRDGQAVRAGQVLIELDGTIETADRSRTASQFDAALLDAARARALMQVIDSDARCQLRLAAAVAADQLEEARELLAGQCSELRAKLAEFDARIAGQTVQLGTLRESIAHMEATLPILRLRAEDARKLLDEGFLPKHSYLDLEKQRIDREGELAELGAGVAQLAAAVTLSRRERQAFVAHMRRATLENIKEAADRGATLQQELVKARMRSTLMTLTAPVDGVVQQLAVHTVGGVVTPAQPLMLVVPRDEALEVEVFLENKDVGFVRVGQQAEIKVETFPYTRYGTVPARIHYVSRDAIADEKRGLTYAVRAKIARTAMEVEGDTVDLMLGMAVEMEIKTGRRRVIEYLLSPLLQHAHEGLVER